eukprot:CAMPEP_0113511840 /NCGR_PEP_ID=MMETSP0014_2-20120614/38986_1 /TAXON_ID=2857 /ORGANISM="Nitzschia sp." /LENGTH=94 /DNA_ID=CAMNT_0000408089 /DNA_START=38 /DNA_END=319 /DNA_ORIENTATION=+ /assembly_acc=CAM_ASM_000159
MKSSPSQRTSPPEIISSSFSHDSTTLTRRSPLPSTDVLLASSPRIGTDAGVNDRRRKKCDDSSWARIVSATVGSTITALAVTPLEVVKVRQQSN